PAAPGFSIAVAPAPAGEGLAIEAEAPTPTALEAVLAAAGEDTAARAGGGSVTRVPLEEVAPRRYRAAARTALAADAETFPGEGVAGSASSRGLLGGAAALGRPLLATLVRAGDSRPLATAVYAPARPQEYVPAAPDLALLRAIAATTGGEVLDPAKPLPALRARPGGGARSLVAPLALAAAILFLLDLAAEVLLTRGAPRLK
ncbi:MAG TPA: hypothetical protein VHF22_06230, partial [Planctomycetota bacterium]|nr:hypothetical protein [Planctomycetota bacterium]